jgi:hypothetical protein
VQALARTPPSPAILARFAHKEAHLHVPPPALTSVSASPPRGRPRDLPHPLAPDDASAAAGPAPLPSASPGSYHTLLGWTLLRFLQTEVPAARLGVALADGNSETHLAAALALEALLLRTRGGPRAGPLPASLLVELQGTALGRLAEAVRARTSAAQLALLRLLRLVITSRQGTHTPEGTAPFGHRGRALAPR